MNQKLALVLVPFKQSCGLSLKACIPAARAQLPHLCVTESPVMLTQSDGPCPSSCVKGGRQTSPCACTPLLRASPNPHTVPPAGTALAVGGSGLPAAAAEPPQQSEHRSGRSGLSNSGSGCRVT